ncbi:bifunctional aminotransferase class I/II-fold pyridoxal phosphate-dependent enzyme/GNAT family N-acetyltransferase [Candidatus Albibeggiatoa sp. nov. NOAA]|uniref:bifunctional aminotransferase class I/II-fold pyridoxal phosphate-dependent enzyme/GNAT family N-acetyltransferase n=1 Tax=Candidatus Albibeggiatoa sp. nov. NOAA TaxID=3162724 RepID=UPI0033054B4E|nr:bifunctional aminotransferase class I/II-fold pyridoxal phosphate-dependent enzyme/GNAT family N-acetyltransferase [Thiotrichaceae bacterium]
MENQIISSIYQVMELGFNNQIIHHHTEDNELSGRTITIEDKEIINFGSCAYLGIEHHEALKQGVIEATEQLGVQFSSSRAYASLGLLKEVEAEMRHIFGQPLIVTPSTTLGHLAAMPVVVEDDDVVILDMQVHSSVQMAAQLLKARGIKIHIIRHNDMQGLEKKIQELHGKHEKIWYMADGVYSMYGDYAPLADITALMERYAELHLYIDDAHGMGWTGEQGMGYVRSQIDHHPHMVMATSMNKSFSAAGGCMIFPNEEMRHKVLLCGASLIFSGPIQPPMLGAALASAKLHQTEEISQRQDKLRELTRYMNQQLRDKGIPQVVENDSPIYFIPIGLPRVINPFVHKLKDDGFLINPAAFPAVPMKRGGLRFMLTCHLEKADIKRLVERIWVHYHQMLIDEGITEQHIAKHFRIPQFKLKPMGRNLSAANAKTNVLQVSYKRSISQIKASEWNALHAASGTLSHSVISALEFVFSSKAKQPENQWDFHYIQVHDRTGQAVLSTFYTTALVKDDMFAPANVSSLLEEKRHQDPYYLNSKVVMLGSMITKGEHLYLNRQHPEWQQALQLLIDKMQDTAAEVNASQLMFREFYGALDSELKSTMLDKGFTVLQLPNNMRLSDVAWQNQDEFMHHLRGRYRSDFRREILKFEDQFTVITDKPNNQQALQACYQLYSNVFERSLEMNVHKLPFEYFRILCSHHSFDIIRLYLKHDPRPEHERQPVGVMFSYFEGGTYHAMIVGLDYEFNQQFGVYKQALYQTAKRANTLNASGLDLAFTADLVKKKIGAHAEHTWAFVQVLDTYNLQVIENLRAAA